MDGTSLDVQRSRALVLDPCGHKVSSFLKDHSVLLKGKVVLDAGCGAGILGCLCARLGASRVFAIVPSPQALALASAVVNSNELQDKVTLLQADPTQELPELLQECRGKGRGTCDILLCEHLLSDLRYTAALHSFLNV